MSWEVQEGCWVPMAPPKGAMRGVRAASEHRSPRISEIAPKYPKIVSNLTQNRPKMVLWEVQAASIEAMAPPNGRRGGSGRPMDAQRGAQVRPRRPSEAQLGTSGGPHGGPRGPNGGLRGPNSGRRGPKRFPKGATRPQKGSQNAHMSQNANI